MPQFPPLDTQSFLTLRALLFMTGCRADLLAVAAALDAQGQ
ncbi:MAG: hypothetical protein SF123_26700 [Chloroflexota bacterium]|nr:hypothetical protein [Chloroflexota bacterium]